MSVLSGLLYCTFYILGCIGLGELLRRAFGQGSEFTRKVVHISVGMVVWLLPLWFVSPWPFAAVCLVFALINWLDWKYHFFPGMSSADQQNLGTVYFPLVVGAVVIFFWGQVPLMVAALMPLTWGDGMAPVIGRAFGRRRYTVLGHPRTFEGTAAFFLFSSVAVFLALWLLPAPPAVAVGTALTVSLLLSGVTAAVEGLTPWGIDNLTITAAAVAGLIILF